MNTKLNCSFQNAILSSHGEKTAPFCLRVCGDKRVPLNASPSGGAQNWALGFSLLVE